MQVHTRVKDKVDAVEGAELQCTTCGVWKTPEQFPTKVDIRPGRNQRYQAHCFGCTRAQSRLAVWYTDSTTGKRRRRYPTKNEVLEFIGAHGNFAGTLNQARHTEGHEEPRAPRKPLSTAERERRREASERRAGKPDMCYLVGMEGDRTAVKIGHSTNVWRRMAQYQAGNPRKLVVLGLIEGGQEKERELHQRFMHLHEDRFVGEWFRLDPAILGVFGARKMP